jgi:hypothetical protein
MAKLKNEKEKSWGIVGILGTKFRQHVDLEHIGSLLSLGLLVGVLCHSFGRFKVMKRNVVELCVNVW